MTVLKKYNQGTSQWEPIVSGTQGPTGPTGPTGSTGPTGPTGPPGINLIAVTTQAGATYTLDKTDAGSLVSFTNFVTVTVTVPTEASEGWVAGEGVSLLQNGSGQVSIVGASGVTVNTTAIAKTRTQYSTVSLVYLGANTWILVGDMAII
jgi:hypothetical protein